MSNRVYVRITVPLGLKTDLWTACQGGQPLTALCVELLDEQLAAGRRQDAPGAEGDVPEALSAARVRELAAQMELDQAGAEVRVRASAALRRALKVRAARLDTTLSLLCAIFLRQGLDARCSARARPRAPSVVPSQPVPARP